jgi:drug/metabolite transporter (DMT)-like permease
MKQEAKNQLGLHFVVILLGFTAILGNLMSISALPIVVYRTFIASTILGLVLLKRPNRVLNSASLLPLVLTGFVLGLHWICFFGSARMSTVSLSLVTFSTTSFFTSIIEPLSKKEPVSKKELLLGLLVVMGMSFIFSFETIHYKAILVGLFGAFLASIYSVSNAHLAKKSTPVYINFIELSAAFIFTLAVLIIWILATPQAFSSLIPSEIDYFYLVILGIICTVIPYLILVKLLKSMSAFTVGMAINMEPIYGILMAWLIFGEAEKMSGGFYIGAVLIILSLLLNSIWKK